LRLKNEARVWPKRSQPNNEKKERDFDHQRKGRGEIKPCQKTERGTEKIGIGAALLEQGKKQGQRLLTVGKKKTARFSTAKRMPSGVLAVLGIGKGGTDYITFIQRKRKEMATCSTTGSY